MKKNTKRNIGAGMAMAAVLIVGGSLHTPTASALTINEIQAQIQQLLAKVAELQVQLKAAIGTQTPPVEPAKHRICWVLYRNLSQGIQGDDVQSLQEFLSEEGYFSANATGYFGPVTAGAVAKWQASQGVSSVGIVGPLSRERIKIWCGGASNDRFGASPQRGPAPLTVTFKVNVDLFNSFVDTATGGSYKILFGDGSENQLACYGTSASGTCLGPHSVSHTYAAAGTYTAQLVQSNWYPVPTGTPIPERIIGSVQIVVGSDIGCTKEYKPVCGSKPIVCITTPCNPIQQTYGNRCMMEADGATILYEGSCRPDSANPEKDPRCKSWYDGCNTCSRTSPNAPAACTLRACFAAGKGYCIAYFDDTSGNKAPTISGFSGPTTLAVNLSGTWTIQASDPENQSLSYRVMWGDEQNAPPYAGQAALFADVFVQTTTFTHAYAYAGMYTITIVVRDASGGEAKTSTTIKVGSDTVMCTMEYAPVCGQPPEPACRHAVPACMIASPGPQTYSNRCMMNAAGATFIHERQCESVAASCTTPWGGKIVSNGQAIIDAPYFRGGSCVHGGVAHTWNDATHSTRHICQNGAWVTSGLCDDSGTSCMGSWNECSSVNYAP